MNINDPFEVQKRAIDMRRESMDDLERAALDLQYEASLDLSNKDKAHVPLSSLDEIYRVLQDRGLIWPIRES